MDRSLRLAVGAALVGAVVVYGVFDPAQAAWFPRCGFHDWTGLCCPGCGGQRALHALLELRLGEALRANALTVVMLPLIAIHIGNWLCGRGFRGPIEAIARRPGTARGLAIAIVAFAVLRNLPVAAGWLAPR